MKAYSYNAISKEFINEIELERDPVAGEWLMPMNATTRTPPSYTPQEETIIYNSQYKDWDIIKDRRGLWFDINNKTEKYIDILFDMSDVPKTEANEAIARQIEYQYDDSTWILKRLDGREFVRANPLMNDWRITDTELLNWDTINHKWDVLDFSKVQDSLCMKAKSLKAKFVKEPYLYKDTTFQGDSDSLLNMERAINNNVLESTISWIDSTNKEVLLTYAELKELYLTLKHRNESYITIYQAYRDEILNISNMNDLIAKYLNIVEELNITGEGKLQPLYDNLANMELDIKVLRDIKLSKINQDYEIIINKLTKEYIPATEMLTWETQERESKLYLESKNPTDCPTMAIIAKARQFDLDLLCQKAIEKSTQYRLASAYVIGLRQGCQDRIETANSKEALDLISFPSLEEILKQFQSQIKGIVE